MNIMELQSRRNEERTEIVRGAKLCATAVFVKVTTVRLIISDRTEPGASETYQLALLAGQLIVAGSRVVVKYW